MERESSNMCRLYTPNWENSPMDQNDPFESALSSMVSSPTASNANCSNSINGGENIVLRELIGRLGSICNSGEISPFNGNGNGNNSSSCYSTPLNSPPKLHLSSHNHERERGNHHFLSLPTLAPPFSADPAFAERAARFSSFANTKLCGSHNGDSNSRENSTVSDQQIPHDPNPRKRKAAAAAAKGKGKQTIATNNPASASENSDEWSGKRSKSQEESEIKEKKEKVCGKEKNSLKDDNGEPQKDYIHVRARRGQATDAHSLAERVRREKISERMKVLQDLVPGCNKVTGKAVMLDEIINYVQSLQRQVEFLSMKLSTVNPRMDFNMEALLSKDLFHSLPHNIYPSSDSYPFQSQSNNGDAAALGRNQGLQLPPMDNFGDAASQVSSLWEDDLHSIVQMGFGTQNFQGIVPTSQMKVEL